MDNITQKWIPILNDLNKVRGVLVPYNIQYDHGKPKQIFYVYEELHQEWVSSQKEYSMGIDNKPYAMRARFDVIRNLENMFPNDDIHVTLMDPIDQFNPVINDEEENSFLDKKIHVRKSIDEQFETNDVSLIQDHVRTTLTYTLNVTTEEMIRRFLQLPLNTHLITWMRIL